MSRKKSPEGIGPPGEPGAGVKASSYTLHLPQTTYLALKLHAAREGVRQGRHVTINEVMVEFIMAGLARGAG